MANVPTLAVLESVKEKLRQLSQDDVPLPAGSRRRVANGRPRSAKGPRAEGADNWTTVEKIYRNGNQQQRRVLSSTTGAGSKGSKQRPASAKVRGRAANAPTSLESSQTRYTRANVSANNIPKDVWRPPAGSVDHDLLVDGSSFQRVSTMLRELDSRYGLDEQGFLRRTATPSGVVNCYPSSHPQARVASEQQSESGASSLKPEANSLPAVQGTSSTVPFSLEDSGIESLRGELVRLENENLDLKRRLQSELLEPQAIEIEKLRKEAEWTRLQHSAAAGEAQRALQAETSRADVLEADLLQCRQELEQVSAEANTAANALQSTLAAERENWASRLQQERDAFEQDMAEARQATARVEEEKLESERVLLQRTEQLELALKEEHSKAIQAAENANELHRQVQSDLTSRLEQAEHKLNASRQHAEELEESVRSLKDEASTEGSQLQSRISDAQDVANRAVAGIQEALSILFDGEVDSDSADAEERLVERVKYIMGQNGQLHASLEIAKTSEGTLHSQLAETSNKLEAVQVQVDSMVPRSELDSSLENSTQLQESLSKAEARIKELEAAELPLGVENAAAIPSNTSSLEIQLQESQEECEKLRSELDNVVKQLKVANSSQSQPDTKETEDDFKSLKAQLESNTDELAAAKLQLENLKQSIEAKDASLQQGSKNLEEAQLEIAELRSRVHVLETAESNTSSHPSQENESPQQVEGTGSQKSSSESGEAENSEIEDSQPGQQTDSVDVQALDKEQEIAKLRSQLLERNGSIKDLTLKMKERESSFTEMSSQLQDATSELEALQSERQSLLTSAVGNEESKVELEAMKFELEESNQALETLREQYADLEEQLDAAESKIAELEEAATSHNSNQESQQEVTEEQQPDTQAADDQNMLTEQQQEIQELKQQLQKAITENDEFKAAASQAIVDAEQIEELSKVKELNQQLQDNNKAILGELELAKVQIQDLDKEKAQMHELEQTNATLVSEIDSLKSQLESSSADNSVSETVQALQSKLMEAEAAISDKEQLLNAATDRVSVLQNEMSRVRDELVDAHSSREESARHQDSKLKKLLADQRASEKERDTLKMDLTRKDVELEEMEGKHAEKMLALERALQMSEDELATVLNNMALLHKKNGQLEDAKPLYERALQIREKTLGPSHKDLAPVLVNYGALLYKSGEKNNARQYFERALDIRLQHFAEDDKSVSTVRQWVKKCSTTAE